MPITSKNIVVFTTSVGLGYLAVQCLAKLYLQYTDTVINETCSRHITEKIQLPVKDNIPSNTVNRFNNHCQLYFLDSKITQRSGRVVQQSENRKYIGDQVTYDSSVIHHIAEEYHDDILVSVTESINSKVRFSTLYYGTGELRAKLQFADDGNSIIKYELYNKSGENALIPEVGPILVYSPVWTNRGNIMFVALHIPDDVSRTVYISPYKDRVPGAYVKYGVIMEITDIIGKTYDNFTDENNKVYEIGESISDETHGDLDDNGDILVYLNLEDCHEIYRIKN